MHKLKSFQSTQWVFCLAACAEALIDVGFMEQKKLLKCASGLVIFPCRLQHGFI